MEDRICWVIGRTLAKIVRFNRKAKKFLKRACAPVCAFSYFEAVQLFIVAEAFEGKIFGLEMNPDVVYWCALGFSALGALLQIPAIKAEMENK